MINFFKFLWMATKDTLSLIAYVVLFSLPAIIGLGLAIFLKPRIEPGAAAFFSCIVISIGYWLYYTVPHCINAVKYLKETGSDSLKEAWSKTYQID